MILVGCAGADIGGASIEHFFDGAVPGEAGVVFGVRGARPLGKNQRAGKSGAENGVRSAKAHGNPPNAAGFGLWR